MRVKVFIFTIVFLKISILFSQEYEKFNYEYHKFDRFFSTFNFLNQDKNVLQLKKIPYIKPLKKYNILKFDSAFYLNKNQVNQEASSYLYDIVRGIHHKSFFNEPGGLNYAGKDTLKKYLEVKERYLSAHNFYYSYRTSFVKNIISYFLVDKGYDEEEYENATLYLINIKGNNIQSIVVISAYSNKESDDVACINSSFQSNWFFIKTKYILAPKNQIFDYLPLIYYSKFRITKDGYIEIAPPFVNSILIF